MTARAMIVERRWGRGVDLQPLLLGIAVLGACVVSARMLTNPQDLRLAVVGTAVTLLVGLGAVSPVRALFGLVVWLTALGFLRRVLNLVGPAPHADPLLIVGPLAIALLFAAAVKQGALRNRSRLAGAVLALNVLMVIGAFNPLQRSFATGLAGLVFLLVPTLAFWVGRGLCGDETVAKVLKLFAVLSIPAAVYGLAQTFSGFPTWDSAWIAVHQTDYGAISQDGVVRAFANFSATSEYAYFLAIGLVVWIGFGLTPVIAPIAVGAIGILAVAIFYEGSRGTVIVTMVALAMLAGVRAGLRLKWSLALGAILILLLPYAVGHIVGSGSRGYSTPFVQRQVEGLQNPTNPTVSTLQFHINLLKQGIYSARHEPVGKGTGAVTIAAAKFDGVGSSAEADPGNAAIAFGIPGLIAYIVILIEAIRRGYQLASLRRDWVAQVALAIVVLTTLQWLNGGQYAVAFLPWLLLGWIDRSLARAEEPA